MALEKNENAQNLFIRMLLQLQLNTYMYIVCRMRANACQSVVRVINVCK